MMKKPVSVVLTVGLGLGVAAAPTTAPSALSAGSDDWTYWRGPMRNGVSEATGLPDSWSPAGDNLAWMAPYGGRSAPVVFGDRLYLQNSVGHGADMQERIMALDADTGELVWEHRFNVTLSDAPPHRVGWSSPVVDRGTGDVYALGVSGSLIALSSDGELLWRRFVSEIFGLLSTHGGRTQSPIIEDGNLIFGGVTSGWGSLARGMHRFMAFDKATGHVAWVSSTNTRAFDTTYPPPIVRTVEGQRLVITGGGDGAIHAFRPATGELIWRFAMSKRGINSGVVLAGDTAIVSHGEENLEDSAMGLVAGIDAAGSGELGGDAVRWTLPGILGGYSSPVLDGDRYYQIDNAANLIAVDVMSGTELWRQNLGTIQRASPVLADGKLYVGTQNGEFFILRPSASGVEIIDRDELGDGEVEEIIASVAVARGRVYLVSHERTYAIGPAEARASGAAPSREAPAASTEPVAHVQIFPQEMVLGPGDEVQLQARLFDARGRHIRTVAAADWSLERLPGRLGGDGLWSVGTAARPAGGNVKALVDGVGGAARMRVISDLPWSYDFDGLESVPPHWVSALGKFRPEEQDGTGVLIKTNDNPFLKRTKVFMGATRTHDYTVQVDFKSDMQRRRLGDAGLIAQRYALILFGTKRNLELQSWQPETDRTIVVDYPARPDTWYTMRLRTDNEADGSVRVRGKLWARDATEPDAWAIDHTFPPGLGITQGSPGFYADAHAVVTFDNLSVTPNQ